MITIFDPLDPPLEVGQELLRAVLTRYPRRLAFAGPAGAGKTTMCEVIGVPIINHADPMKEEILTWLAHAVTRGLRPDSEEVFLSVCHLLGLSPELVRPYMWDSVGPLVAALNELLAEAYTHLPSLYSWTRFEPGEKLEAKVAFVDQYKTFFRTSLQIYGQLQKDLGGNPAFWAERTVERTLGIGLCSNGDTRFPEEAAVLRATGWTLVWLEISRETQQLRRPDMTDEQLNHVSENSLTAADCDLVVDANPSLNQVVYILGTLLGSAHRVAA